MTHDPNTPSPSATDGNSHQPIAANVDANDGISIDLRDVVSRLCRGLAATLGFAGLGVAIAALIYLAVSPFASTTTSMRVTFAFDGFARGEYPDHSKFQPDDIRAPDVIAEALKRQGLKETDDLQVKVRAALTVEGLIPPNVIKERDRLRAAGQTPAPYIPEEYLVTLALPRISPIPNQQREQLLNAIVGAFQEKFQRTYAEIPLSFGNAFDSLREADFYEYDLILNGEVQNITAYLRQQIDQAKTFRSPTTNLSFNDLIVQTDLFSQLRLFEVLGFIRQNGLSRNRGIALMKMDYFLRMLNDQEQQAVEDEKVVDDLLTKSQERSQNYVLGIKSQAAQLRPESPIIDQGLIDSLLANDSSNFLVRQALAAGLKVKGIQAEKAQLMERRKDMEAFVDRPSEDRTVIFSQVTKSLGELQVSYNNLISNIRKTHADFARQQFADAIRISMQPVSDNKFKPMEVAGAVGGLIGLALGIGLSLLGVYVGPKRT